MFSCDQPNPYCVIILNLSFLTFWLIARNMIVHFPSIGQGLYRVINLPSFQSIFPLPIWAHDEQDIHWWWPQTFFHMLMSQSSPNNTIIINSIQSQQHSGKNGGISRGYMKSNFIGKTFKHRRWCIVSCPNRRANMIRGILQKKNGSKINDFHFFCVLQTAPRATNACREFRVCIHQTPTS